MQDSMAFPWTLSEKVGGNNIFQALWKCLTVLDYKVVVPCISSLAMSTEACGISSPRISLNYGGYNIVHWTFQKPEQTYRFSAKCQGCQAWSQVINLMPHLSDEFMSQGFSEHNASTCIHASFSLALGLYLSLPSSIQIRPQILPIQGILLIMSFLLSITTQHMWPSTHAKRVRASKAANFTARLMQDPRLLAHHIRCLWSRG